MHTKHMYLYISVCICRYNMRIYVGLTGLLRSLNQSVKIAAVAEVGGQVSFNLAELEFPGNLGSS